MRNSAALLAVLVTSTFAAAPCRGAELRSVDSGEWTSGDTWSLGRTPAGGDVVYVEAGDTVTISGAVTSPVSSVWVLAGGVLRIPSGGALLRDAPGNSAGWLTVDGTLIVNGLLGSTATGAAASEDIILRTRAGSQFVLEGEAYGSATVTAISAEAAPALTLTVSSVPAGATHVQVASGWFPGTVYRIVDQLDAQTIVLSGGLVTPVLDVVEAAADSVVVPAQGRSAYDLTGAVIVDTGGHGRLVDAAFERRSDDTLVCFVERPDHATGFSPGDEVLVTETIVAGTTVNFFRAARLEGGSEAPEVVAAGAGVILAGNVRARWFEVANTSRLESAITIYTSASEIDFDDGWLHHFNSKYQISVYSSPTGPDDPVQLDWSGLYVETALGPDNGDYGHCFAFEDADFVDQWVLRGCTARRTLDDFVFARKGAALTLQDCRVTSSLSGNLVDAKATNLGMAITVERCRVFGYGENAIQADEGSPFWNLRDNLFSRCGAAFNTNTVDGHNATLGVANNVLVFSALGFVSVSDTMQWAVAAGATVGAVNGGVVFRDALFRFNGVTQTTPGVQPFPSGSQTLSAVHSTNEVEGSYSFENCVFEDNPRRGIDMRPYGRTSRGIVARGGRWILSGCTFSSARTAAETAFNQDADIDGSFGLPRLQVESTRFTGSHRAILGPVSTDPSALSIVRCLFLRPGFAAVEARSAVSLRFNSIVPGEGATGLIARAPGVTALGNVFVSDAATTRFLQFTAVTDTVAARVEWNVQATGAPATIQIAGSTVAPAEWQAAHDQLSWIAAGDPEAWALVVGSLKGLELFPGSVAVDFVTDPAVGVDADGSYADAGALPFGGNLVTGIDAPSTGSAVARLQACPNPFASSVYFAHDRELEGPVHVEVFDLRGRRVRHEELSMLIPGALLWDGRDGSRDPVAAGMYFVRVVLPSSTLSTRVSKLR